MSADVFDSMETAAGRPPLDAPIEVVQVVGANPDACIVADRDGNRLLLPATEQPARHTYQNGEHLVVVRLEESVVSSSDGSVVSGLFASVVPELRTGEVRIMKIARVAGLRSKVAVAATKDTGEFADAPEKAFVGRGANRARQVTAWLGGESVDVIRWHPDTRQMVMNALAPGHAVDVKVHEDGKTVTAWVERSARGATIGKGGANRQMAGQLAGVTLEIADADEA